MNLAWRWHEECYECECHPYQEHEHRGQFLDICFHNFGFLEVSALQDILKNLPIMGEVPEGRRGSLVHLVLHTLSELCLSMLLHLGVTLLINVGAVSNDGVLRTEVHLTATDVL